MTRIIPGQLHNTGKRYVKFDSPFILLSTCIDHHLLLFSWTRCWPVVIGHRPLPPQTSPRALDPPHLLLPLKASVNRGPRIELLRPGATPIHPLHLSEVHQPPLPTWAMIKKQRTKLISLTSEKQMKAALITFLRRRAGVILASVALRTLHHLKILLTDCRPPTLRP